MGIWRSEASHRRLRRPLVDLAGYGLSVGVQQELAVVEAQTASGFVGAVKPIAAELPGTDIWQEDMTGLIVLLDHGNA